MTTQHNPAWMTVAENQRLRRKATGIIGRNALLTCSESAVVWRSAFAFSGRELCLLDSGSTICSSLDASWLERIKAGSTSNVHTIAMPHTTATMIRITGIGAIALPPYAFVKRRIAYDLSLTSSLANKIKMGIL